MAYEGSLDRPETQGERFLKEFSQAGKTFYGIHRDNQADKLAAQKNEDPYKQLQQTRLDRDSKYKQYSGFIKEADALLKGDSLYPFRPGEKEALRLQRDQMAKHRDRLIALSQSMGLPSPAEQETPENEGTTQTSAPQDMEEENPKPRSSSYFEKRRAKKKNKPKFNPKNKDHVAKFDQLHGKFGADEKKIREVLSKEFELD
jgi:hypothetical protein